MISVPERKKQEFDSIARGEPLDVCERSTIMNQIYGLIDKMDCESLKIVHINIKRIFLYGA